MNLTTRIEIPCKAEPIIKMSSAAKTAPVAENRFGGLIEPAKVRLRRLRSAWSSTGSAPIGKRLSEFIRSRWLGQAAHRGMRLILRSNQAFQRDAQSGEWSTVWAFSGLSHASSSIVGFSTARGVPFWGGSLIAGSLGSCGFYEG